MTNGVPMAATTLPTLNVFLRDCASNTTSLVSVNLAGTGGGDGNSVPFGISTNGQFVLFESAADNLAANDTNNAQDIFVRDVVNGTTTLVSVNTNSVSGSSESRDPVMTPDGHYVAFTSAATDLVPGDTNGIADVFVRDLQSNSTTLVSVGAMPTSGSLSGLYVGSSETPEITSDGRYVAFYSTATNLVPGVTTTGEIYVRDLVAGNTIWASAGARSIFQSTTGGTNEVSCNFSLSADGQFVGFETCMNPPSGSAWPGIILRYNVQSASTDFVFSNAAVAVEPSETIHNLDMTPDGRFITFVANVGNNSLNNTAIYLWDAQTGSNTLISADQTTGGPAVGISDSPVVSTNGQYVAFLSNGTNLVSNPLNGQYHVYLRDVQNGITTLQDVGTNDAGFGVSSTTVPSMSSDGHVVAFESGDDNVVPGDGNSDSDVFALVSTNSSAELVSAHDSSLASVTPNGLSGITATSLSSNGRYLAWFSDADNIVPGDTNGFRDVFVRDLVAGTDVLVSMNTNGVSGGGISSDPSISGDGRYVAFTSSAGDLVANGSGSEQNVYIRDWQVGTTALVSVSTDGIHPGNANSYSPTISADGRYVLFHSLASSLASGSFTGENLFVRDLQTGITYALTSSTYSFPIGVYAAAMTPDGRYVAFWGYNSGAGVNVYVWNTALAAIIYTNSPPVSPTSFSTISISPNGQKLACSAGTTGGLYTMDLSSNTASTIQSSGGFLAPFAGLQFSGDGRFLTYAMSPTADSPTNVYVYDFNAGTNILISQNPTTLQPANGPSDSPAISSDGRFIAYRSASSDLVAGSTNAIPQLIVYDQFTGSNTLLTTDTTGTISGDNRSLTPVFSGDGRTLVFASWASNLAANDFNHFSDVFAFAFLYANVTAGTTGQGSTVTWPFVSGHSYQVEYKNNLTDSVWQQVVGTININGSQASMVDPAPASSQRFYRVVAE